MNWAFLERFPGFIAVPITWRKYLGDDFEPFKLLCLQTTSETALSFPCPLPTSCSYRIVLAQVPQPSTLNPQLFDGLCKRDPQRCPPIQLTLADITPLELNWPKLARAVAKAFGLNSKFTLLPIPHTVQVGTWSADAVPVILTIQTEPHHFRHVVTELIARLRQKFILFAPTSHFFDAVSQELLATVNAAAFQLDTNVTLTCNGNLLATKTPGDLFAKFTPPLKELDRSVAERAFALIQQFDPKTLQVFRFYCIEELSAARVARKLKCSRLTVLRRLKQIRAKTGTDPKNLRRLSDQLRQVQEDSLGPGDDA